MRHTRFVLLVLAMCALVIVATGGLFVTWVLVLKLPWWMPMIPAPAFLLGRALYEDLRERRQSR